MLVIDWIDEGLYLNPRTWRTNLKGTRKLFDDATRAATANWFTTAQMIFRVSQSGKGCALQLKLEGQYILSVLNRRITRSTLMCQTGPISTSQ